MSKKKQYIAVNVIEGYTPEIKGNCLGKKVLDYLLANKIYFEYNKTYSRNPNCISNSFVKIMETEKADTLLLIGKSMGAVKSYILLKIYIEMLLTRFKKIVLFMIDAHGNPRENLWFLPYGRYRSINCMPLRKYLEDETLEIYNIYQWNKYPKGAQCKGRSIGVIDTLGHVWKCGIETDHFNIFEVKEFKMMLESAIKSL